MYAQEYFGVVGPKLGGMDGQQLGMVMGAMVMAQRRLCFNWCGTPVAFRVSEGGGAGGGWGGPGQTGAWAEKVVVVAGAVGVGWGDSAGTAARWLR